MPGVERNQDRAYEPAADLSCKRPLVCASVVPSGSFSPLAPMCRLNVDVLCTRGIDPFGSILAIGERQRVDISVIAQDADFEITVGRS